ncbi:hypothetical protein BC830DRAFT_167796 [Chytriomyces sp. MP71]|nr:hypothetical protein BC830DRAFT_167796 [Chytriomyces sp. MP71]
MTKLSAVSALKRTTLDLFLRRKTKCGCASMGNLFFPIKPVRTLTRTQISLDGGLRTKKKKPLVVPIQPPPPIAATSSDVSDKRGVADTSEDAHPVKRKRAAADSDRVVMIAGMPFCALSVAEQKVLQEVADALKEHEGIQDDGSISIARGLELSAMSTGGMIQSNGDTLVPSASARLTALSSCLNKLRAITVTAPATSVVSHDPASVDMLAILANVSAGENGDNELKEENARLKVKVAHLMELLKAQNGVLHNVRQRVVTDE